MNNLNVAEWTPEQVAEWLSGLGPSVTQYVPKLLERRLTGAKLLTLRCDDLEYYGIYVIGHQELLLEAVEHLRNYQYEVSRECVQQLAVRVSAVATSLARALQLHVDARLETQILADVARVVRCVKPLVCWLDRWPLCSGAPLAERKAALLKQSLEAATCAQRDRFAENPTRAVAAAAAAIAATADYIIQDVSDPMILQPASVDSVTLKQGKKPLGFAVVPSFCGHHQVAHIVFGSPAHASGSVHEGDEILQVGSQCVVGWSGEAVERACSSARGELALRLRRRGARGPLAALGTPQLRPLRARRVHAAPPSPSLPFYAEPPPPLHLYWGPPETRVRPPSAVRDADDAGGVRADSSSEESEALSPPASPTHLHPDHTRMYPPKPRASVQRRYTISCGSPVSKRPNLSIEQFWQELKEQKWLRHSGSDNMSPVPDYGALYRRDKAVSCSTGLEISPRPRTCLGVSLRHTPPTRPLAPSPSPLDSSSPIAPQAQRSDSRSRGKLDKSHSTPAYDFDRNLPDEPGPLVTQIIPESPTTPTDSPTILVHSAEKVDQILDFKKSSSQIGEAILQQQNRRATGSEEVEPETKSTIEFDTDNESAGRDEDSKTEKILETINIAMMERHGRGRRTAASAQDNIPHVVKTFSVTDHVRSIQEEIVQAINEQRVGTRPRRDTPPSPPPRPLPTFPPLRPVPRVTPPAEPSPLKPVRAADAPHISLPLRHLVEHEMRLVRDPPSAERDGSHQTPTLSSLGPSLAIDAISSPSRTALSPTASSVGRGIFLPSKSKSLKKKNSFLARRRAVSAREASARGVAGAVWQRVRARAAAQARWAQRHLVLVDSLLYAYRGQQWSRADCMIYLAGCTVCAAGEVKSRAHAFKVYHTGTAFYFATDTRDDMLAWINLIHRATLLPPIAYAEPELAKQFSETDYSETESDTENSDKRNEPKEKEKDKDKSKFGSLKKLTRGVQRSESQEAVGPSSTSLDRKYLRFFSRSKNKEENKTLKNKQSGGGLPVPTEHYRSYRRTTSVTAAAVAPSPLPAVTAIPADTGTRNKIPKPINYIHASNPNLLDFEKSDFVTKPTLQVPKPIVHKPDNFIGFVTLEEFMLKKQEEERRQVYTNRVLMGIEKDKKEERSSGKKAAKDLKKRLDRIVPDVIYGEVPGGPAPPRPARPTDGKPISVRGKDGYETIVYPDEKACDASAERLGYETVYGEDAPPAPPTHAAPDKPWRDSLRRNDKVHSQSSGTVGGGTTTAQPKSAARYKPLPPPPTSDAASGSGDSLVAGVGGPGVSRLRLMFGGGRRDTLKENESTSGAATGWQYPPTFEPESYSLAKLEMQRRHHADT